MNLQTISAIVLRPMAVVQGYKERHEHDLFIIHFISDTHLKLIHGCQINPFDQKYSPSKML